MSVTIVNDWKFREGADLEAARAAATELVAWFHRNEPGVELSLWLEDRDDPLHNYHVTVFEDAAAAEKARASKGIERFVERFYPHVDRDTHVAPTCDAWLSSGAHLMPVPQGPVTALHEVPIDAPPEKVHEMIATSEGLRRWWTRGAESDPRPGGRATFTFGGGAVTFRMRVETIEPPRLLAWRCEEATSTEWEGTTVTFKLTSNGDGTTLRFAHAGWHSSQGDFAVCNSTWGDLLNCLKHCCEGGEPNPRFEA